MRQSGLLFLILLLCNQFILSQKSISKRKLSSELNEISGLEKFNDTILIAINDGGNSPELFFLDLSGKIIKKTVLLASNNDWEDLTMDDHRNLYIADVGNNLNNRKDLALLKLNVDQAFVTDSIAAEKISFNYFHQTAFPSPKDAYVYDCEAVFWWNDSLRLLTKITSKPRRNKFTNGTFEYAIPSQPGTFSLKPSKNYWTGGTNKLKHQVTAADSYKSTLAILTYGYLFFSEIGFSETRDYEPIKFKRLTQKESLVFLNEKEIIVAAERNRLLGGPYLYTIKLK
jgi:hypothetical protein